MDASAVLSDQCLPARQLSTARPQRCRLQATAGPGNGRGHTGARHHTELDLFVAVIFVWFFQSSSTSPPRHRQKQKTATKGDELLKKAGGRPTRLLAKSRCCCFWFWCDARAPMRKGAAGRRFATILNSLCLSLQTLVLIVASCLVGIVGVLSTHHRLTANCRVASG